MFKGQSQCQKRDKRKNLFISYYFNQYTSYLIVVLMSNVLQYAIYDHVVVFYMLYTVWVYEKVNYIKEKMY